jgi:hypothetical protein
MRKESDEAAAEFAIAGVAADTATKMPIADAAFRISDWHEAKALDTMCVITLLLRPAPFLAQYRSLTKAVDLPTPYEKSGVRWLKRMQQLCNNRGTSRRSNALSR